MGKNIINNWVTESYPCHSVVQARHRDGDIKEAHVRTYIVEGAAQNIPTGVIVEFADNSMVRFGQGELQNEAGIKPARG